MSSDKNAVTFQHVWKKYSRDLIVHRSIREDIANVFRGRMSTTQLGEHEFWALRDVCFEIKQGETIGLYGPNGSGKSTILKLIAGVTFPTQGTTAVCGRVAPLIEIGAGFHPDLTGRENIMMNGAILGMDIATIKKKTAAIIDFSGVEEFIDMPVKKYSRGMYVRLAFSVAIHSGGDIYLIDEILAIGDEDFQKKCMAKISELKNLPGTTFLIVSQDLSLLKKITDRIIYIQKGEIPPQEAV